MVRRGSDPAGLEGWKRAENNLQVGADIVVLLLTLVRLGHSCARVLCGRNVYHCYDGVCLMILWYYCSRAVVVIFM